MGLQQGTFLELLNGFQLTKVATVCEIGWHGVGSVYALYTEGGVVLVLN